MQKLIAFHVLAIAISLVFGQWTIMGHLPRLPYYTIIAAMSVGCFVGIIHELGDGSATRKHTAPRVLLRVHLVLFGIALLSLNAELVWRVFRAETYINPSNPIVWLAVLSLVAFGITSALLIFADRDHQGHNNRNKDGSIEP